MSEDGEVAEAPQPPVSEEGPAGEGAEAGAQHEEEGEGEAPPPPPPPPESQAEEGTDDAAKRESKQSLSKQGSKQSLKSAGKESGKGSGRGSQVSVEGSGLTAIPEEGEDYAAEPTADGAEFMGEYGEAQMEEMVNYMEPVEKRVLVVGQCFMDFVLLCDKYTPENTEQFANESFWQRGGNGSNVATALRLMETPVEFFGVLSNSFVFACLLEDFRERGIYIHHCPRSDLEPPMEHVLLSQATGSHTIIRSKSDLPVLSVDQFQALGDLSQFLWIHFEGHNVEETLKMMKLVRAYNEDHENKIKVSLSLELLSKDILKLAAYSDFNIMGNQLARHMGWNDPEIACKKLRAYLDKHEAETCLVSVIIVPWSEQGAAFMDVDDSVYMIPAYPPIGINDTLGVGDLFIAAFIHALLVQNRVTRDAVDFANYVCSFKIAHRGFDVIRDMPQEKNQV